MGWSDEYLEHHGILGQKWGVRRFENKNGTLTPAGRKRYDTDENGDYKKVSKSPAPKSSSSEGEPKKKGLSDKQKKLIIAGAAVAGTALAVYGGYKLYQLNQQKSDKLGSQKKLESVKKQYTIDRAKWERGDQSTPPPLPTTHSKAGMNATNKLASEASALAKSVTAQGPKSFSKPAQNGPTKEQMTQQKLKAAQESHPKIDRATVSHTPIDRIQIDRATVDRIKVDRTPINMESFNKAAQANDDLVSSLLKKNTKALGL